MKITKLTTYRLAPRWMFLKVETDEGVTGWGEPVIEGRARSVDLLFIDIICGYYCAVPFFYVIITALSGMCFLRCSPTVLSTRAIQL